MIGELVHMLIPQKCFAISHSAFAIETIGLVPLSSACAKPTIFATLLASSTIFLHCCGTIETGSIFSDL